MNEPISTLVYWFTHVFNEWWKVLLLFLLIGEGLLQIVRALKR